MNNHTYTVTVKAGSRDEADQVMNERIQYEEDYGFPYEIDHEPTGPATFVELSGDDLEHFLRKLTAYLTAGGVQRLRVETRRDGAVFKVNEGTWTSTIGKTVSVR